MTGDFFPAMEVADLWEHAPIAVYVSELETFKMLYSNRMARQLLLRNPEIKDITCYQAAGFNEPCPFCHTDDMDDKKLFVREFFHPISNRIYELSGKIIDWNGKPAHVEYIADVTEKKKEEERARRFGEKLEEAKQGMEHLVNSIPGGIMIYRIAKERLIPEFYSDGVIEISGHTREEFSQLIQNDVFDIVYERDRDRVVSETQEAVKNGTLLMISYRMYHKDGSLIWVHVNGRRMGTFSEEIKFYAVITGISEETKLYQDIANESADGIYVIGRDNYELLYLNESKNLFAYGKKLLGQKCYTALHGKSQPCEFCTLKSHASGGEEHQMLIDGTDRFYTTRFRETDWNGVPAYIKYVHDATEEVKSRREKERLEQYFQTVVKNLPGGVAVIYCKKNGSMVPEYLSAGFAAMTNMTTEKAWQIYKEDAMAGVHPDDRKTIKKKIFEYASSGQSQCEMVYRLQKGDGGYIWVKNILSLIQNQDGEMRFYAVYHDITKEREEQEHIRRQYNDLIIQHYRAPNPNTLLVGYCNITQNRIMDFTDYTDQGTLKNLGMDREQFLIAFSSFILDEEERRKFLNTYRREPTLAAFKRSEKKRAMKCFIHLPGERRGRYVEIETNMVFTPENRDVAGVLSLTDITDKIVADRIMNRLSVTGYDFVADLDLIKDRYQILSRNQALSHIPPNEGSLSQWRAHMLESIVIPRDIDQYKKGLDPDVMLERLKKEDAYTFTFSVADDNGDIRTKNMIVSAIDLRIGRVCLSRIDITDSIREQQGFLNMLAYTFELAGLIDIADGRFLMYTRNTVLKNLPPYIIQNYNRSVLKFCDYYDTGDNRDCVIDQFRLTSLIKGLSERPSGYDFVLPYTSDSDLKYKQINVLWGDENHKTICLVRADVTDILTAERKSKAALENALLIAKEASKAKSDFLSSMSHDIRTPMNAIMGMTTLAVAHIDDQEWVTDCLQKISASSKHLLSLINDVLDMSKIESSKITLNHMKISLEELMGQLSDIMASQAGIAGVELTVKAEDVKHQYFYGDALRINQILINILSNAVKFTPEGGWVHFTVTELSPLNGEKWVRYRFMISDNGAGISKEALPCIFDSFTRSSRTSSVEGTGLGLSITKGLVDLMGGRITVESQPGQGSTFYVELEFEISESQASETKFESQCSDPTKEKIFAGRCFLVCEDTPINAEILREMLKMQGAQCVIKTDGLQAVKTFTKAPPGTYDAILMDIQMPVMNGYEAARAIRKMGREDAATIPIIAMTANAFAEDIQLSLEAGMDAHVAKPIDIRVLKNTLCTILNIT